MVFCAQWNSWVAWRHWLDEAMLRYQPGHIVALYVSCYSKNYSLLWPGAKSMERIRDKDTRYFLEIDIKTLKIVDHRFEQEAYLGKGRQPNATSHRMFITEGQYNKFVERCVVDRL